MINITKQDINIYRTASLVGAILILSFWGVYRQTDPNAYDPLSLRVLMATIAVGAFVCTYIMSLRRHLLYIIYGLFYLVLLWFMWLLFKNHYTFNYFMGFILVIYITMLGLKRPLDLVTYIISVIVLHVVNIIALRGHADANLFILTITMCSMFLVSYFTLRAKWHYEETIRKANAELSLKNKEITDSITYARRIQSAMLPSTEFIYEVLKHSFILYKPKDVVSGDFYAFAEKNGKVILAAVDCTGHGVPGAFMSMIGHNLLSEIITERGITEPGKILGELNKSVRKALKQHENQTKDGMDAAIVAIDIARNRIEYAGANRPLWIVGKREHDKESSWELNTVNATKATIGGHTEEDQIYQNHEMHIHGGDAFYLFSDGYADQFGGAEGKKMMTKRFKEYLVSIQDKSLRDQESILNQLFEDWKGSHEQVDDVLVIGVKM